MIVASWTAYGCYVTWTGTGDSRQWRVPLAIQIIPALILGSMIYLFPEVCFLLICWVDVFKDADQVNSLRALVGCVTTIGQKKAFEISPTYTHMTMSMIYTFGENLT